MIPIPLHILFTNLGILFTYLGRSAHHQAGVRSGALPSQGSKPGEETDVSPPSTASCSRKVCVCVGGGQSGKGFKEEVTSERRGNNEQENSKQHE